MNQRLLILLAALLTGIGCHETTSPRPDNSRPVLTRHADTLTSIGDTLRLAVNNPSADVVWESRNQQIATVTQTGRVTAISKGESWVLVFRQPGIADSTQLVVDQKVASVTVTPGSVSRPLNRTQQFLVLAVDANAVPVPGIVVTWSASGNAATIDPNGVAMANAVGTATVKATVQGVVGSATLSVTPLPSLRFNRDTIDIGVGQYASGDLPGPRVMADSSLAGEVFIASLSVSDPAVAQLTAATVGVPGDPFQLLGLAPGMTRVTTTAANYSAGSAIVRVSTPRLQLLAPRTLTANAPYSAVFVVEVADSLGVHHAVVQPLPIRIHATTPGVLLPVDTTVIMPATNDYLSLPIEKGTFGQTWIVATAAGYRADSAFVTVSPAKLAFVQYGGAHVSTASIGAGGELYNGNLLVYAGCCQYTDLPITITQRHPEALSVPHSLLLPAMSQNGVLQLQVIGLQPTTDTLIASAAGFLPDTLVFHVTTPTFAVTGLPATASVGSSYFVTGYVADSLGNIFYPSSGSQRATVTSSDPTVLRPSSDVLDIGNTTGGGSLRVAIVGPGTATLTLSDPSHVFAPATSSPIVVAPTKLYITPGYPPSTVRSVGMHQLVEASVQIATLGSIPDSIRLRSTDPTVAQPTASAIPSLNNGTNFLISGGDRSGTAWIVASAPGLISDSVQVAVGRPAIAVSTMQSLGIAGQSGYFSVHLVDQTGNSRQAAEALTFRIESSDPSVLAADSTITVPAGQGQSGLATVRFVGPGSAVLRVVDDRNVPYAYEPGATVVIQVTPAQSP